LAGCDLLTISPKLLAQLQETSGELPRRLDPAKADDLDISKVSMNRSTFDQMHSDDPMASEKLTEGIKGFSKALETLESLLKHRLMRLEGSTVVAQAADDIFQAYDLDGDGFITREEWIGTDAVFDALDVDSDGKITPAELKGSLGVLLQIAEAV
jgi:transaldolase